MPLPPNPYKDGPPGSAKHLLQCRVSPEDYYYLKRLFPMTVGMSDKILSNLIHAFINELRSANLDPAHPDDIAWETDCRTYAVANAFLARICGRTVGRLVGEGCDKDDGRRVLSTSLPDGHDASVGTDTQSAVAE